MREVIIYIIWRTW